MIEVRTSLEIFEEVKDHNKLFTKKRNEKTRTLRKEFFSTKWVCLGDLIIYLSELPTSDPKIRELYKKEFQKIKSGGLND